MTIGNHREGSTTGLTPVGLHGSDRWREIAIDALWSPDGSLRRIRGVTVTHGGIAWATIAENEAALKTRNFRQRSFAWRGSASHADCQAGSRV